MKNLIRIVKERGESSIMRGFLLEFDSRDFEAIFFNLKRLQERLKIKNENIHRKARKVRVFWRGRRSG